MPTSPITPDTPAQDRPPVGVVGLGQIGTALAERLLATGHRVHVVSRRPEAAAALKALGAVVEPDGRTLASHVAVVFLSANTAAQVEAMALGADGVFAAFAPTDDTSGDRGLRIVDTSSISPEATRRLAAAAAERGIGWIDAPLSGGAPAAREGRMTLMLGGEADDVAAVRPWLDVLSARATHLGGPGAGQSVKIINQVLVGIGLVALSEAAVLTHAAGLDPVQVLAAIGGGRAASKLLQEFCVKFARRDETPGGGRLGNMVKDLRHAQDVAREAGLPLPLTSLALDLNQWLVARGHADADIAATLRFHLGDPA